jgi:exopolysaccharide biosynthesis polyprenyl glycosylphosphotransferase
LLSGGHAAADGGITQHAELSALRVAPSRGTSDVVRADPDRRRRFAPAPVPRPAALVLPPTGGPVRRRLRWMQRYQLGLVGIDLVAATVAGWGALAIRYAGFGPGPVSAVQMLAATALPLGWVAVIAMNRAYEGRFVGVGQTEFERIFRAFLHLTALVAFVSYATRAELARGFVLIALPLALALDILGRYGARKWLHRQRGRGRATHSVLAVGDPRAINAFVRVVERDQHAGMRVRGACVTGIDPADHAALDDLGVPLLGNVDTTLECAQAIGADTVAVVSSSHLGSDRLRWISWQLEGTDIDLVVSPGITEVAGPRLHIRPVAGLPLLHVDQPEFRGFRRFLKATMDRTVAVLAITALSPVFLLVYVAIRATTRGPAFFRQVRVGRDGRTFTIVKFRSMFVDAESRLADLRQHNVHGDGPLFKMHADPRVTRVGRVLRRYSLDELPQLFNVLLGHMSLVGPRPPLPSEVSQYADDTRRRLLVKPGLTGLWQVSGRSDLTWEESVRLDLRYVENWSPALDLMILWKTAFAVLRGAGAY